MNAIESDTNALCELAAEKTALILDNIEHEAAITRNNVRLTAIRKELVKLYRAQNQTERKAEDVK